MPILLSRTIRLFLDSIGRRDEYEFYLSKFLSSNTAAFAILCPTRAGFEEAAPAFTFDLSTLLRLELFPVVLLHGPQASEMMELLLREEHQYADCSLPERGEWTAGDVEKAMRFLADCRARRCTGIIRVERGALTDALRALTPQISRRIHVIRPGGPLKNAAGEPLPFYYTARSDRPLLAEEDRPLAEMAEQLLNGCPGLHISVATPWNLMEELFTVKGAGCVIRKGSFIDRHTDMAQVDRVRLLTLLESSFGRKVANPALLDHVQEAYVERGYMGAALLENTPAGSYLSKFAVGVEARGVGLAQELWDAMLNDHPRLFWRARSTNPINQWYEKQSDGYFKTGEWRVFWRGIRAENISDIIRSSLDRGEDFEPGVSMSPQAME